MIANTPSTPYYAVIFTSVRTEGDDGYDAMSDRMSALALQQPGFLGVESARNDVGITVSYWKDLASIKAWKADVEHLLAQKTGRSDWYARYTTRIARVERDYSFENATAESQKPYCL